MPFTPNIPQANDDPSQSQPLILDNFQGINTLINVNHVDFDEPDEGKHKFMQMPQQSAAPVTAVNEGALYTKESTNNAVTAAELFYRAENNGSEYQITNAFILSETSGLNGPDGQFKIPGGLIVKWGRRDNIGNPSTVTFATAFPTACLSVQVTPVNGGAASNVVSIDPTLSAGSFVARSSPFETSIFFLAIGN